MKNILITGGANGLGFQLAHYYAKQRHNVTVLDVSSAFIDKVKFVKFDLSKFDEQILNELNDPFDIVICNAGISISGDFKEISFEDERNVFEVNTFGHMQLMKYLLQNDLIAIDGRVAFISSATEFLPFPIALTYSASKSALIGFANALEAYTIPKNISVTRIYPGPMNTDHKKYYPGAQEEGGRLPEASVPAIVRGIDRRKRKVYPDPLSKLYKTFSRIAPRALCHKTYNFYKDRIK